MKQFNHFKRMPIKFEKQMTEFFNYKWAYDRNFFLKTEDDEAIL
jgi:hypothetical protein